MPAVIGIGAITALAFALAAVSMSLLVRTLVVAPIRGAANGVSGIPVIGGALAWALTSLAIAIELAIGAASTLASIGQQQALALWNYMVGYTVDALPLAHWATLAQVQLVAYAANGTASYIWNNAIPAINATISVVWSETLAVTALAQRMWYQDLPQMRGIDAGLRTDVDIALRLAIDILNNQLPALRGIEAGLRADLNSTTGRLADVQARELPRIQADVNSRARSIDVDNLSRRVDGLAAGLAALAPLLAISALSSTAINELRNTALDPCRCLDLTSLNDLQERVSALELE